MRSRGGVKVKVLQRSRDTVGLFCCMLAGVQKRKEAEERL
jgi:hypothetical protein